MERPPYEFHAITHFSVRDVEKHGPRCDGIKTLTLEVGSHIPPGSYPLVLIKPFPPLGRPGEELDALKTLHEHEKDIDFIWAFRKRDDGQWARVEIHRKAHQPPIYVWCDRIEGVPGWDQESGDITLDS